LPDLVHVRLAKPLKAVKVKGAVPGTDSPEIGGGGDGDDIRADAAYEQGYKAATKQWSERFSEVCRSLDNEAALMNTCRCEFLKALEKSVVDLGMAVAEKFLISGRERREYAIPAIVHSVLEKIDNKEGNLTIALNPVDLEALDEDVCLFEDASFKTVRITGDQTVPQAGCRLDTGLGSVAYDLEEQMKEIKRILSETEVPADETVGD